MLVEILVGSSFIAVGVAIAAWIKIRRENRRLIDLMESLLPEDANSIPEYTPEECDVKLSQDCRDLVSIEFPQGVEKKMLHMSLDERKELFENLVVKAAEVMDVDIPTVKFNDSSTIAGSYNSSKDVIMISEVFLASDSDLEDSVNTVFHELKHKIQYEAIKKDGNKWGYSERTIATWYVNTKRYIRPEIDPNGYYYQPLEVDARGFADSIII